MRVVIDTSVLFQSLYSSKGASHAILNLIREGALEMLLSIPVFEEYCDVLQRENSLKQFDLTKQDVWRVLDFIAFVGIKKDIHFLLRPNLQDENDNMFIDLAFAGKAEYIITKNIKDFTQNTELKLENIQILTPAEFMREWRAK